MLVGGGGSVHQEQEENGIKLIRIFYTCVKFSKENCLNNEGKKHPLYNISVYVQITGQQGDLQNNILILLRIN